MRVADRFVIQSGQAQESPVQLGEKKKYKKLI